MDSFTGRAGRDEEPPFKREQHPTADTGVLGRIESHRKSQAKQNNDAQTHTERIY